MVKKLAKEYAEYVISLREELHQYPETDFNEFKTNEIIKRELDSNNIPYKTVAKTGIVALIKGKKEGKTVLLRADIDGLPINEETSLSFKSKNEGYMHACGHDIHTACLLGAAKILNQLKDRFAGNVKLIFQPAEEGVGGAMPMIDEGILDNPKVDAAFALHVEPLEKTGNIQIKNGAIMACPDEFEIKIEGRGGHGSAPQECVDPIEIAASIIKEFKAVTDLKKPCVVSVCSIHSGTCHNVIPQKTELLGTLRALDNKIRFDTADKLKAISEYIAKKYGGKCEFIYKPLYPPVINDETMNEIVIKSAKNIGFIKEIKTLSKASMAGDDFSYIAERVPSSYFRLGVGNDTINYPIHSPKFNADNESFKIGTALMAQIAIDFLNS